MTATALPRPDRRPQAFTLVELLVSTVVLLVLIGIIFSVTSTTGAAIGRVSAKIDAFASGRVAFDLITQRLSQATLNTYYDYYDAQNRASIDPYYTTVNPPVFFPVRYGRQSDLQFLVRQNTQSAGYGQEVYFVMPQAYSNQPKQLATQGLLNACSFFVQYGRDAGIRPTVLSGSTGGTQPARRRYRLMQGLQPTEGLAVFQSVYKRDLLWLGDIANATSTTISSYVAPVADNVLALIVWPRLSEADDPAGTQLSTLSGGVYPFTYDSRSSPAVATTNMSTVNQLPPNVQVTMVVISEASALRFGGSDTPPAALEGVLANKFADVTKYTADLQDLTAKLSALKVQYQVFSTSVPMRESRWTGVSPWPKP